MIRLWNEVEVKFTFLRAFVIEKQTMKNRILVLIPISKYYLTTRTYWRFTISTKESSQDCAAKRFENKVGKRWRRKRRKRKRNAGIVEKKKVAGERNEESEMRWQSPFPKWSWQASFLATCIKPFSNPSQDGLLWSFLPRATSAPFQTLAARLPVL